MSNMPAGSARVTITASNMGGWGYKIEGDHLGRFALLSVMRLVEMEMTQDVYEVSKPGKKQVTEPHKTAQNTAKIDVQPAEDYTDGVSMPKHEAIAAYLLHMEKMRDRVLAIEKTPDDETFIVPADLLEKI